jgi:predicted anti-sigma-YlaC factor YlaD
MAQCEQFRNRLAEYVVGALKGRARSRIEEHLRECAVCRAELAALERTGAILHGSPLLEAPDWTWDAISRRIAQPARNVTRRLRWAWGAAASAVAVVLIVIAFFVASPNGSGPTQLAMSPPAEEEMDVAIQGRIPAAWAAPLSDEAAIGLRFMSTEDGG